jgi:hypothetical protein
MIGALSVLTLSLLQQTPPNPDAATQAAERAAAAAERAAQAAERSAAAVEALVKAQTPPPAPAAAPAPAPAPAEPGTTPWTGTTGLSLIWLSGNSNTLTFNASGGIKKDWRGWGFGLKGFATYGEATLASGGSNQVTALAAGGTARGERNISDQVMLFVSAGANTDHVKSVEYVVGGDVGAGITWLHARGADYEKLLLRTDLSVHCEHEADYQYYPTPEALPERDLLGPRVALAFRYALRKDVIFIQDAEVIPNVLGASRVRVNALTKLASRLTGSLSMTASFQLQYDSVPPAGKVPTDTALSLGVELAL